MPKVGSGAASVELKNMGWGPRIAAISLILVLLLNFAANVMAYQQLVDTVERNTATIEKLDDRVTALPPASILATVSDLTESMASLTLSVSVLKTTVEFVAKDIADLEAEMRENRAERGK